MSTPSALHSRAAGLRRRLDPVWRRVRARFEVDTRALAAARILLGLTLLGDLLYRALYFEMFYTDSGVYPLSTAEVSYTQFNGWSLHLLSGELWVQQLLFVLAGLFAVAFIVGYRTRLVGFVSLVLLFSLHGRNPAVLNGGDRLLRVLLLVMLVAPIGERWSVDALRRGSARKTVASFGTAALLAQPLAVFTANAIEKHEGETWYTGDGLEIAMRNDTMSIFLGDVLTEFPGLMTLLNYMWIGLLAGCVVFLLLPVGRVRALAALAYLGAFAGMGLTMSVGVFPYALAASVIPYLTPPFWDLLARFVPRRWTDRLPDASWLGPLGRSPLEHRLLDRLRSAGYRSVAGYTAAYARSLLTIAGLLMLVWVVLFTAVDLGEYEIPGEDSQLDQQTWGLRTGPLGGVQLVHHAGGAVERLGGRRTRRRHRHVRPTTRRRRRVRQLPPPEVPPDRAQLRHRHHRADLAELHRLGLRAGHREVRRDRRVGRTLPDVPAQPPRREFRRGTLEDQYRLRHLRRVRRGTTVARIRCCRPDDPPFR